MGSRIRRLITPGSILRLIGSIILAFIVWGFVVWETNPERTRQFNEVPIETVGLAPNMEITNEIPTATIVIKGPESVVEDVTSAMVSAYVDLSGMTTPGTAEYEVHADTPSGLRKVLIKPEKVTLDVAIIETRTFAVDVAEPGERPANVSGITVSQDLVQVIGSRENVEKVASVQVEIDYRGQTESFQVEARTIPVDEAGNVVPGVRVDPPTVTVDVHYEITEKALDVVVYCACVTDGNLQVQPFPEAVAIPSTVTVTGPSPVISELNEIHTQPIDIAGLSQSGWILEVDLDETSLPAGVQLQETTVDVWVPIQAQRVTFSDVPIQVININPEYRTTLSEERVSFEVDGPQDVLDAISGTTPLAIVDGQQRGPGTYRVSVQVVLPPGVSYTNLEPAQVDLTVIRTQPQSSPPVSMPRTGQSGPVTP